MRLMRNLALIGFACLLVACGGGGGGSSSPPPPTPPPAPTGTFTLSGNNASFVVAQDGSPAPAQFFDITVTGTGVASMRVDPPAGQSWPSWLSPFVSDLPPYRVAVGVNNFVSAGDYSGSFVVSSLDAANKVLQQKTITASLRVYAHLTIAGIAPVYRTYVFGDAARTDSVAVDVHGPDRPWSLVSNVPWIRVPAQSSTGNQVASATIDLTGLAPGNYSGILSARDDADGANGIGFQVSIIVTAPTLQVQQSELLFGGQNGNAALTAAPLQFSISTGAGIHPFTATVTTDADGSWLQIDNTTGTVGAAGSAVTLNVSPGLLPGATRTAQVAIDVDVYGTHYTDTIPVTWNREANTLVTSASGIALSRIAGRSVLSRTLKVFSGANVASTPWTAQSNVPWLSVTPSGTAGGDLTITATPGSLPLDATQFGTVTVTSSDPLVINQQTIRVGLHLSNTAPVDYQLPTQILQMVASPTEPLVAVVAETADVQLYNIYTGALVRTLTGVVAAARAVTWKGDGTVLYVYDSTNLRVRAVNPQTGAVLANYDSVPVIDLDNGRAIATLRPNGREILVTPSSRIYDLVTNQELVPPQRFVAGYAAMRFEHSPDQSLLVSHYGSMFRLRWTALRGGGIETEYASSVTAGANACFSASGDRIYGNDNSFPYTFPATSVATGNVIQALPGAAVTVAVACSWNGMVAGGMSSFAPDIYTYYGPTGINRGNLTASVYPVGNNRLTDRGLEISGDGTRLIAITNYSGVEISPRLNFLSMPSPP